MTLYCLDFIVEENDIMLSAFHSIMATLMFSFPPVISVLRAWLVLFRSIIYVGCGSCRRPGWFLPVSVFRGTLFHCDAVTWLAWLPLVSTADDVHCAGPAAFVVDV